MRPEFRLVADTAPVVLRTEKLEMVYPMGGGDVHALRELDLDIRRGDFVAIMGSSGCGKSTLLHVVGGLLTPTEGRVMIDGLDLTGMSDAERTELRKRKLGFVFQRFNLVPTLNADRNVKLAEWIYSGSWSDTAKQSEHRRSLFRFLGLEGKQGHRPSQLSGGEQQRVAIARALINDPLLLLADEPTGNLDSENSEKVLELLAELNQNLGQTIVMITHDPDVARYATRVMRMKDGRLHE